MLLPPFRLHLPLKPPTKTASLIRARTEIDYQRLVPPSTELPHSVFYLPTKKNKHWSKRRYLHVNYINEKVGREVCFE